MIDQGNSYASNRTSRFIEQANEAIYNVEERERLGINITRNNKNITPPKKPKKITRIRKSFSNLRQSILIEHAKEAMLLIDHLRQGD